MAESFKRNNVHPLRLRPDRARDIIHAAAQDTANVIFGTHALQRMEERGVSDLEVYRILRTGYISEPPERTDRGEWKCKVIKKLRGQRTLGVITVIMQHGRLFIKTVEWED